MEIRMSGNVYQICGSAQELYLLLASANMCTGNKLADFGKMAEEVRKLELADPDYKPPFIGTLPKY